MGMVRTRILASGCALVAVATAAYYGGAPARAESRPVVAAAIKAARHALLTLPIKPSPRPSPAEGDGYDQIVFYPERHRGLTPDERHALIKDALATAAAHEGLDPGLLMAVAWWESGWDMSKVSDTGAIGIMQIDPSTAQDLGPRLLGREIDPHSLADNIDLGAAVLKADLADAGGDLDVALASYYEGGGNVDPANLDPNAQAYVAGVRALQQQFDSGQEPSPAPS